MVIRINILLPAFYKPWLSALYVTYFFQYNPNLWFNHRQQASWTTRCPRCGIGGAGVGLARSPAERSQKQRRRQCAPLAHHSPPSGLRDSSGRGFVFPQLVPASPVQGGPFGLPSAQGVAPSRSDLSLFTIKVDKKWTRAWRQDCNLPVFLGPRNAPFPTTTSHRARRTVKAWRAHWGRSANVNTTSYTSWRMFLKHQLPAEHRHSAMSEHPIVCCCCCFSLSN